MVWKKSKRSSKESKRPRTLSKEAQPKLRSCLKKTRPEIPSSDNESSKEEPHRISGDSSSTRDHESCGSVTSTNCSRSLESRNSIESSSQHQKGVHIDHHSCTSESSTENGLSSQRSERSIHSGSQAGGKKRVRFNAIQIRDYERVVGDNPSCTSGPPLSIGWSYGKTSMIDVNSYEMARTYRKKSVHLILSREEREALLLNWGASFHDIVESVRGNIKVKNQRRQTVTNLGRTEKIEEAFESATRKLKRALLLRRSTGNKVKRLQEQANLAQSALASLKIAEERALNEIRRGRVPSREEPEKDNMDNFNLDVAVSDFARSAPMDSKVRRKSHLTPSLLIVSEEEDYYSSFDGFTLGGNSSTPSQLEMERFYRELEFEMFGDEELPSMVGQTLEVPAANVDLANKDSVGTSAPNINLDDSLNSGIPPPSPDLPQLMEKGGEQNTSYNCPLTNAEVKDEGSCDDIDAALELERNRSMISRSLLEDDGSEVSRGGGVYEKGDPDALYHHYPLERMYPVHGDFVTSRYHSATSRLSSSLDSADPERGRLTESVIAMEYHFMQEQQTHFWSLSPQLAPMHHEKNWASDRSLLGNHNGALPSYGVQKRHSPRLDSNEGPSICHLPPPSHFSLSHWVEDTDSTPIKFDSEYHTITICEDSDPFVAASSGAYNRSNRVGSRYIASQKFPPNFY